MVRKNLSNENTNDVVRLSVVSSVLLALAANCRTPILAIIKIHSKYNVYFLSHLDLFSLISLKVWRLYYNVRA